MPVGDSAIKETIIGALYKLAESNADLRLHAMRQTSLLERIAFAMEGAAREAASENDPAPAPAAAAAPAPKSKGMEGLIEEIVQEELGIDPNNMDESAMRMAMKNAIRNHKAASTTPPAPPPTTTPPAAA